MHLSANSMTLMFVLIGIFLLTVLHLISNYSTLWHTYALIVFTFLIYVICSANILIGTLYDMQHAAFIIPSNYYRWIAIDDLKIDLGSNIDLLTISMLFIISSISGIVLFYSIDYMHAENGSRKSAYFTILVAFIVCMNILVVSNNFLSMFVGWEGVGICSYLLINYWYLRIKANKSALLAVIINKIGDIAFLIGICLCSMIYKNIDIEFMKLMTQYFHYRETLLANLNWFDLQREWIYITKSIFYDSFETNHVSIETYASLLLIACIGKSSQFGLHHWLPEAMEGPTPVSALLHAATMVTAGIYLIIRVIEHFHHWTTIFSIIILVSSLTIVYASIVGMLQTDLKKIIAYSTMSQLGYMLLCRGIASSAYGFYHLMIHAFFKALLFLVAGLIIHIIDYQQDIRKVGGFIKSSSFQYALLLVGSLALVGFLYSSGYYSKELIIDIMYNHIRLNTHWQIFANFFWISYLCIFLAHSAMNSTLLYCLKCITYIFLDQFNFNKYLVKNINVQYQETINFHRIEATLLFLMCLIVIYMGYYTTEQNYHDWF